MRGGRTLALVGALAACTSFGSSPTEGDAGAPPDGGTDAIVDAGSDTLSPDDDGGIGFVQVTAGDGDGDAGTATLPFRDPVHAGNAVIVTIGLEPSGPQVSTVTDSVGGQYKVNKVFTDTSVSESATLVSAFDLPAAGPNTLTVTLTARVATFHIYAAEYTNVAGYEDARGARGDQDNQTDHMDSSPAVASQAGELVIGFGVSGTVAAGTSFTSRTTFAGNVFEDRLTSAPGGVAATATSLTGGYWMMLVGTFQHR
jgi:hypothetical protein